MDVFETDYSNLFAAGLRGIQSRSTGRSSSEPQLYPAVSSSAGSADHGQDVKRIKGPGIPSSFWKTFLLPTRLWPLPSRLSRSPRIGKAFAFRSPSASTDAKSKPARPQAMPRDVVEETPLNLRILDWSLRVSNATAILDDEDECVDPYLLDKVDPVDVPASTRTTILVTLPTSTPLGEQAISPLQGQRDRHMSLQTLSVHKMLATAFPYDSFFSSDDDDETTWETASAFSSDESGLDDDWHQFRVEWIDFDGAH